MAELETVLRSVTEELTGWRRRCHRAESECGQGRAAPPWTPTLAPRARAWRSWSGRTPCCASGSRRCGSGSVRSRAASRSSSAASRRRQERTPEAAVRVTIGGEELTVRSELPGIHPRGGGIRRCRVGAGEGVGASIPPHKAAILAALAITDELFQARRSTGSSPHGCRRWPTRSCRCCRREAAELAARRAPCRPRTPPVPGGGPGRPHRTRRSLEGSSAAVGICQSRSRRRRPHRRGRRRSSSTVRQPAERCGQGLLATAQAEAERIRADARQGRGLRAPWSAPTRASGGRPARDGRARARAPRRAGAPGARGSRSGARRAQRDQLEQRDRRSGPARPAARRPREEARRCRGAGEAVRRGAAAAARGVAGISAADAKRELLRAVEDEAKARPRRWCATPRSRPARPPTARRARSSHRRAAHRRRPHRRDHRLRRRRSPATR